MSLPDRLAILRSLRGDHCFCRTCGEYFNSTAAFDKHRVGGYSNGPPDYGRRCRTPDEMRAAGMTQNATGWWLRGARQPARLTNRVIPGDAIGREPYVRARPAAPACPRTGIPARFCTCRGPHEATA